MLMILMEAKLVHQAQIVNLKSLMLKKWVIQVKIKIKMVIFYQEEKYGLEDLVFLKVTIKMMKEQMRL
jgi:hypothetical protein